MNEWLAVETKGQRIIVQAATYGEAVEMALPAVCAQWPDWNCVFFNTGPRTPLVVIDNDTGAFEVWTVCPIGPRDDLTTRMRGLAAMYEQAADDLDDVEDKTEWRDCRWARAAFDEIATDLLTQAHLLDQLEDEQGAPAR